MAVSAPVDGWLALIFPFSLNLLCVVLSLILFSVCYFSSQNGNAMWLRSLLVPPGQMGSDEQQALLPGTNSTCYWGTRLFAVHQEATKLLLTVVQICCRKSSPLAAAQALCYAVVSTSVGIQ